MTTLTLGHSPDPDDAFMFYGLATEQLDTAGIRFEHVIQDIETLNRRAENEELDITAMSVHAYGHLSDRYRLLRSGASMGERYGPLVVAREAMAPSALGKLHIAIPGERTSAFLTLRLCIGAFRCSAVPFDEIMERVADGEFDAGLLIHEGQLTYQDLGLKKVIDLGEWWDDETGLPLPLGVNAIRRSLGDPLAQRAAKILKESIEFSLAHRAEAVQHSLRYARGMGAELADSFVGMYVNETTLDFGDRGEKGILELLGRAARQGLIPGEVRFDPVG